MTNFRRTILFTALLLLHAVRISAQEPQPKAAAPEATENNFAAVYVYRIDSGSVVFWFLTRTMAIKFGTRVNSEPQRREIAGLKNKRYFILRLPPGKYNFKTEQMYGSLDLEVAANTEYYLRADQGFDCPSEPPNHIGVPSCVSETPSIYVVPPDKGRAEIVKTKPIKLKNVKDKKLVVVPPEAGAAPN